MGNLDLIYKLNIENNNYTKDDEKKLIDLIEKPIWKLNNTSSFLAEINCLDFWLKKEANLSWLKKKLNTF